MDRESNGLANEPDQTGKTKYLTKLLPIIKYRGLSHMRIDDIVRAMDISKATFYKHFASKDEVIERIVEMVVSNFQQASAQIGDATAPYLQRFQSTFIQSLLIANYLSDIFLIDLKQSYPTLWERVKQAQQERQRQIQAFYEQGVTAGVFQPINSLLVVLQDELMLRGLINPVFLIEHDLTLRTLLYEYYQLQKYQWLVPAMQHEVDDTPVKAYIDMLARKISLGMHSDGLR